MQIDLHQANRELKRNQDTILVLGDGQSMPTDLERFLSWDLPHDVAALGRGVREYPGMVHHWFNADGEQSIQWSTSLPSETIKHTLGEVRGFDTDWDLKQDDYHFDEITGEDAQRMHGSSALFATLACLELGYEKIVLAGCPLDTNGHYYFPQSRETLGPIWLGFDFLAWLDFSQMGKASRVRSMSGYTKIILGDATQEWAK